MLSDERLAKIGSLVFTNLNEDEEAPAKGGIAAVNARVYAVKANYNRLLDVARETYKENVSDIFALNRTLSDMHGLPLSLLYQEMGFRFTSMDLKKMNARMKDALDETFILSEKIIQDLVADILVDVRALYNSVAG
ncbi:hypothetical protein B0H14DRAFT_3500262 [Mycena olivaceomarginata]|nr:hypothetical protein B0H14DRAFT_3500262 [Mycena olivaceomarginata]